MNLNSMFSTIDTHVLGENFRIIIQPPIGVNQSSMKENDALLQERFTQEKNFLLNEPRGHRGINGCIVHLSDTDDFNLFFFNHEPSISFKYEGVAASLTALLETGYLAPSSTNKYSVNTSFGKVYLTAIFEKNEVSSVVIDTGKVEKEQVNNNVFILIENQRYYKVEKLPSKVGAMDVSNLEALTHWGGETIQQYHENYVNLEGVIVVEKMGANHYKTITFEKDGYIRRAPGIDSTKAILAMWPESIQKNTEFVNETIFSSKLIIPEALDVTYNISYQVCPFIIGSHDFVLDSDDPLPSGFLLK